MEMTARRLHSAADDEEVAPHTEHGRRESRRNARRAASANLQLKLCFLAVSYDSPVKGMTKTRVTAVVQVPSCPLHCLDCESTLSLAAFRNFEWIFRVTRSQVRLTVVVP